MTRKQALSIAIKALSEIGENEEAVAILRSISDELPMDHWTDAAIRDSVEQFILDHNRVPTATDFKKRGLPPHTVIKNRYGVALQAWLHENYPAVKSSEDEKRKQLTKVFIEEYRRIKPKSAEDYNAKRAQDAPCWYTIAVHNQTKRWRELLDKLELPIYNNTDVPRKRTEFTVNIYTHYDFRD